MKRTLIFILVMLLTFPATVAMSEEVNSVISCPQLDFSTLVDFGYRTEYSEEDGLYIRLGEDNIPYVLVTVSAGENRVTDPAAYFNDYLAPMMHEKYASGGPFMSAVHEAGEINGHSAPVLEVQYISSQGYKIKFYAVFDVQPGYTAYYRARYVDEADKALTLGALETVAKNLKPDAHYYDGGAPRGSDTADPKPLTGFNVSRAASIVPDTVPFSCAQFTATLPAGWTVQTGGLFQNYAFKCYDPNEPRRCLFVYSELGSWLKSQAAKDWWNGYNPYNIQQPLIYNAPVLSQPTIKCVIENWEAYRDYLKRVYPLHLAVEILPPDVLADINQARVLETFTGPVFEAYRQTMARLIPLNGFPDASINRFSFVDSSGAAGEGLMGGITIDTIDPNRLITGSEPDVWFYYANCVMGCTAPMGELQELAPTLIDCAASFRITDDYIAQANRQGACIADLTGIGGDYTRAWQDRDAGYDVISQKYSDATLGYDRLYDSETGEVYRADLDFYDSYDLHRDEYANPNLIRIDESSEQYYLNGVDYYITR